MLRVPKGIVTVVRLEARLLAKIDQVPRGQLAEFEEDIASLVSGDRQACERSGKQGDKPIKH
jgi:hypothetical protein